MKNTLFLILFLYCSIIFSKQTLKIASPFQDHMVIQRDRPAKIWGWTEPYSIITVEMNNEVVKVYADSLGYWITELKKQIVGGPYVLKIMGEETVKINDVYVGDVWLCSGQSNMDMTVAKEDRYWCGVYNETEEVANANYPLIRFFDVEFNPRDTVQKMVGGKWEICSPENVGHLSAAAYFFARELYNKYKIPIGLLTSAYGASTAEAWTDRRYIENETDFQFLLQKYARRCNDYDTNTAVKEKYLKSMEKFKVAKELAQKEGKDIPRQPKNPNPHKDQHSPCVLYNGMIAPLVPYTIKGAIWYQGESNTKTAHIYDRQMKTLIYNWRNDWRQGDFPFIYVQLANYKDPIIEPVKDDPTVWVRDMQLKNLDIRNTAMVVAIDNANPDDPENIHPKNKQEIGRRLAIAAMGKVYDEPITFMGPVFNHIDIRDNRIILFFDFIGDGFSIKGEEIKGFAIAGESKNFEWAKAKIEGKKIIVWNDKIEKPLYVRYGWSINPPCNLYNKQGLPASPFRSDDL